MTTDDLSDRNTRKRIRARHTKSRRGCFTCKGRRVKCDEIKPTCGACALRSEPCNWPSETSSQQQDTPDRPQAESSRAGRAISPKPAREPSQHSSTAAVHPDTGSPRPLQFGLHGSDGAGDGSPLNMIDLQLHSHFMLHTAKHMSLNPRRQRIWETVIPRFSLQNEALMHLLLALAGLDYASDREPARQRAMSSDEETESPSHPPPATADYNHNHNHDVDGAYLQIIIEHHQRGLEAFRASLANLSSANVNHVFAGSMLLAGFALASLRIRNLNENDAPSQPSQPRVDWIFLIQGLCTVIKQNWPQLRMGPLRDMTQYCYANDDWRLCPRETLCSGTVPVRRGCSPRLMAFCRGALEALTQLINYHESFAALPEVARPRQLLAEQKAALEILEGMYMRTLYIVRFSDEGRESPRDIQADLEDAAIMSWPEFLPGGFLDTLAGGGVCSTLSYVILAYFHLLFSLLESFWYIKGGFDGEIVKIKSLVDTSGETDLVSLMQWPVSVIAVS